jgi:hypothetical protein
MWRWHFPTQNVNEAKKIALLCIFNRLTMNVADDLKVMLAAVLSLGARKSQLNASTALLGCIPELDLMAVVNAITAMEDRFGTSVSYDGISADTFATLGGLVGFVEGKLNSYSRVPPYLVNECRIILRP